MNSVQIRLAGPEDKPERLRVTQAAWRAAYSDFIPSSLMDALWKGEVQESSSYADSRVGDPVRWLAELDDFVVGHIGLVLRFENSIRVAEVSPLYVSPDCQGKGVGRILIETLESHVLELNLQEIWVFALTQGPAIGFYERQGFQFVRIESLTIGTTCFNVSAMRKILTV